MTHRFALLHHVTLAALAALVVSTTDVSATPGTQRARMLMGTLCTVVVEGDSATAVRSIARAFDEIARLEQVMSSWQADSELNRFNAAAAPFSCSADLYEALRSARRLAGLTGGTFDPTIEPLNLAWDLRGRGRQPSAAEIEQARASVDWRGLILDDAQHVAHLEGAHMAVDLGGLGKGIALDRAAELFDRQAIERALINFGGELLAVGSAWPVAIADPRNRLAPCASLTVSDAAVSTSGQAERGIEVGEARFGHILDPRTGYPVPHAGSVTVVAASATEADALSTALFVMGREACARFAAARPDIGVLWLEPSASGLDAWQWNLTATLSDEVRLSN